MSRKKRHGARIILSDPKYDDLLVSKAINILMKSGKKGVAERALYGALSEIEKKTNSSPIDVFRKALSNVRPIVEVRSRRVGGATYQVPTEVRSDRSESLGIRWLVAAANQRTERTIGQRLANEILDASNNRGIAVKKREDTHKMAEANKAFAHFRW